MDTKCNIPNDKDKRHDLNVTNENNLNGDESLLRQPLRTSLTGFREAKRAYENGTDEVRHLLMQECSIIYECNVCRNMFRSLANFISHKRIYCKQSAEGYSYQSCSGQNSSVLIQTIEHAEPVFYKSRSTGSSPVPTTKSTNRDLSKVIERLKRVDVTAESTTEPQANKANNCSSSAATNDPVLQLERVSTTNQAVYQTLTTQNATDSIKIELDEVHNLLTNQKTLLGADGKVVTNHNFISDSTASSLPSNELKLLVDECNYKTTNALTVACEICKIHFQTEKTLKIHIQKKHTASTYVFQCPTCSMTFLQPAAVIRHLANEHKKPLRRIRKMRDTILKKRIQIGDVQEKGLSREVKRLQLNDAKDSDGSVLPHQNGKPISSCSYCKKNFERRAALATHLNMCPAKKTSCSNGDIIKLTKTNNQITNQHLETNQNNRNEILTMNKSAETIKEIKQEPLELNDMTNSTSINEMFENLENQSFGNGLQTVSLDSLDIMVGKKEDEPEEDEEKEEIDQKLQPHNDEDLAVSGLKKKAKRFRVMPASKQLTCRCKICNKQFNALSNLRRHISMFHYRSRRFGCKLCDYRAFRRYDIVNHLTFVHKMTDERETMAVEHVTVYDIKYSKDDVEGDIVVVNEQAANDETNVEQRNLQLAEESSLKTYEKRRNRKKDILTSGQAMEQITKAVATTSVELSHTKIVRKKFKKSLYHQEEEQQKRPIRNRIKTVNNDFVYDLPPLKEESKEQTQTRLSLKRRNTMFVHDPRNSINHELTAPIKITPYRLRTEPLIPNSKETLKGFADSVYRNVVQEALAAPSTLPELPTERPQMRPRHISGSRPESNSVPIIETSELDAARSKSTLFDDSFLEKFAKKANPSFKMKPLLALQHSPLSSLLQKFDTSLQNNNNKVVTTDLATKTEDIAFLKPTEKSNTSSPPSYAEQIQTEIDVTPNGKHILEPSSPPSTPKKRITLMQRLAENRARRRDDSLLRNALEN